MPYYHSILFSKISTIDIQYLTTVSSKYNTIRVSVGKSTSWHWQCDTGILPHGHRSAGCNLEYHLALGFLKQLPKLFYFNWWWNGAGGGGTLVLWIGYPRAISLELKSLEFSFTTMTLSCSVQILPNDLTNEMDVLDKGNTISISWDFSLKFRRGVNCPQIFGHIRITTCRKIDQVN